MNMLSLRNILMVLAVAGVSLATSAQEVYKTVNADGVVEYSDSPTPDAQEVEVKPNVVDVTPVPAAAPPREVSSADPETPAEPARQTDEIYTEANRDRDAGAARRVIHEEASAPPVHQEQINSGGRAHASPRR
jgi:hypothetical protein